MISIKKLFISFEQKTKKKVRIKKTMRRLADSIMFLPNPFHLSFHTKINAPLVQHPCGGSGERSGAPGRSSTCIQSTIKYHYCTFVAY